MVVERLQPIMTLMVIALDPAAAGSKLFKEFGTFIISLYLCSVNESSRLGERLG